MFTDEKASTIDKSCSADVVAPRHIGDACTDNSDCLSSSCTANICAAGMGIIGSTCSHDEVCASKKCVSDKCVATVGVDLVCEASTVYC